MKSWPIFDEKVLSELNHRSAEVHLSSGFHMMAIALLAGFLSVSDIGFPEAIRENTFVAGVVSITAIAIICVSALWVFYMVRRKHEDITASVTDERSRGVSTPWITRLLCLIAVMFILLSIPRMGSTLIVFMIMTGIGLGALSISEFLSTSPGTLRSSLVMVLAGAVTAVLMGLVFPGGETLYGSIAYLVMSVLVMLEIGLERAQVSWSGAYTGNEERVMRIILIFAALVIWLVGEDAESSRYERYD